MTERNEPDAISSQTPEQNARDGEGEKIPALIFNWLTLAGTFLAAIGFFTGLLTLFLDALSGESQAYTGLLYLLYVMLIGLGFLMMSLGALRERSRRRRGSGPSLPANLVLDIRNRKHIVTLLAVFGGCLLVLLLVAVGSYKTFQATETNAFCGQLCHTVMSPEFGAYSYSSHARVHCVECHIGSGADWFLRSKISGLRQIIAVTTNSFPRPIPTPISNLRPARETCEQCHWPQKFAGYKETVRTYFLSDEDNTQHSIRMLMKIGGEEHSLMKGSGIHYHMLLSGKVEYIARDTERQDIAWVRITRAAGGTTVYEDQEKPLSGEEKDTLQTRTMDCLDCHNRPSHQFPTPMRLVNQALDIGSISRELPFIKVEAVRALDQDYESTKAALAGIESSIFNFYRDKFPDVFDDKSYLIARGVDALQSIYRRSIFPEMKAKWSAYPDNIGHRDWPGCFRCHNDRLISARGTSIFTTCGRCHLILAQGENVETVQVDFKKGLAFLHPGEEEAIEEFTECTDCHDGGLAVYD